MSTIGYDDIQRTDNPHVYTAEASELFRPMGLGVGEWPRSIDTGMGNGQPLIRCSAKVTQPGPDGDLLWVTYRQGNGCIVLRVFND